MQKTLQELYLDHHGKSSDKWSIYFNEYERAVGDFRNLEVSLLEIGVQNGGSLELWLKYFNQVKKIVGCDINPKCKDLVYEDERVSVIVADANLDDTETLITNLSKNFNIIIDDGSHTSSDIVKTFNRYFPYLSDGGIYIVEDLHCSYWHEFEGGLFDNFSSISFFKKLIDIINYEHWGVNISSNQILEGFEKKYGLFINKSILENIHSIEFINSMCVIRKNKKNKNILGKRLIAGDDFSVVPNRGVQGLESAPLDQSLYSQSIPMDLYDREVDRIKWELAEKNRQFSAQAKLLTRILNSRSWRFTMPLRSIALVIAKIVKSK